VPTPHLRPEPTTGRQSAVLPPPFACSWTTHASDAAWMHVAGELDIATVPQLERTLGEPRSPTKLVVLDLRELEFLDGSGVQAIVRASLRARLIGRRLLLRGAPFVDRVFALTGTSGDVEAPRQALRRLAAKAHAA
jgi:anti-anti-sigma factor